jgi:hypothetical protein
VRTVLKIAQETISLETRVGAEEDSHVSDFIEDRQVVSPGCRLGAVRRPLVERTPHGSLAGSASGIFEMKARSGSRSHLVLLFRRR